MEKMLSVGHKYIKLKCPIHDEELIYHITEVTHPKDCYQYYPDTSVTLICKFGCFITIKTDEKNLLNNIKD